MGLLIALIVLILVALAIAVSCIKIVPQANAIVVERLGGYLTTWSVGLHFKAPFIDRVAKKVLLKEQVVDFPPQPVITKDNVCRSIPLYTSRSQIQSFMHTELRIRSWQSRI